MCNEIEIIIFPRSYLLPGQLKQKSKDDWRQHLPRHIPPSPPFSQTKPPQTICLGAFFSRFTRLVVLTATAD
jgi:hypothetical protein